MKNDIQYGIGFVDRAFTSKKNTWHSALKYYYFKSFTKINCASPSTFVKWMIPWSGLHQTKPPLLSEFNLKYFRDSGMKIQTWFEIKFHKIHHSALIWSTRLRKWLYVEKVPHEMVHLLLFYARNQKVYQIMGYFLQDGLSRYFLVFFCFST